MEMENKDSDTFKQLNESLKRFSENLIEQFKAVKQIPDSIKRISGQFEVDPDTLKKLNETLNVISGKFEELRTTIQRSISPNFEKLIEEIPDQSKQVYSELAERGWFLDLDLTLREALQLTSGTAKEVEEKLIERFNSRVRKIEQSITEEYPGRKKIIVALRTFTIK